LLVAVRGVRCAEKCWLEALEILGEAVHVPDQPFDFSALRELLGLLAGVLQDGLWLLDVSQARR
jgi:hypothetical protein